MSPQGPSRHLLIVDEANALDSMVGQAPLLLPETPEQTHHFLQRTDLLLGGIFVNPASRAAGGLTAIRWARHERPATPLYLLYGSIPAIASNEYPRIGVQGAVQRPVSYDFLSRLVDHPQAPREFPVRHSWIPDSTAAVLDQDYLPVPAVDFFFKGKIPFDVHVRLPSGKYLKVLNAQDAFDPERVRQYLEKGVEHFYIARISKNRALAYCDQLAHWLLASASASGPLKFRTLVGKGESMLDELQDWMIQGFPVHCNLDIVHLEYANNYLRDTFSVFRQKRTHAKELVPAVLEQALISPHALSVTWVSGLLALPLGLESENAFKQLGQASLFHDVSLLDQSPALQAEAVERLAPGEQEIYYRHAHRSADLLAATGLFDEVVLQAVAQHHERRDNSGFPQGKSAGDINRLAEVIGIADELVIGLQRRKADPSFNLSQWMESKVFWGFSPPVVDAFRSLFGEALGLKSQKPHPNS